jgi:hypothetical protein
MVVAAAGSARFRCPIDDDDDDDHDDDRVEDDDDDACGAPRIPPCGRSTGTTSRSGPS